MLLSAPTSPIAQASACRVEEPWLWAWRGLASYTVPKIDVQVSGIIRSQPNVTATNDPASNGLAKNATYFQTQRGDSGGARPADRRRRDDRGARPGKAGASLSGPAQHGGHALYEIIRLAARAPTWASTCYNLFNANTGTSFNQNFGTDGSTWLRPNAILNPRYVRFNATVDF